MARVIPYQPGPVPDTGQPELERYLAEELGRIGAAAAQIGNIRVFGGMTLTTVKTFTSTTTPQIFTGWDLTAPGRQENVTVNTAAGTLTVAQAGVYYISVRCATWIAVGHGQNYYLTCHVDGAVTGLRGFIYGINTNPGPAMEVSGLLDIPRNGVLDLRYSVSPGAGRQFWVGDSDFSIIRLGKSD